MLKEASVIWERTFVNCRLQCPSRFLSPEETPNYGRTGECLIAWFVTLLLWIRTNCPFTIHVGIFVRWWQIEKSVLYDRTLSDWSQSHRADHISLMTKLDRASEGACRPACLSTIRYLQFIQQVHQAWVIYVNYHKSPELAWRLVW